MPQSDRQPNSLINETSPYLLQHAYNPVQWYPWNEISWGAARKFNRPVLLSIGYSSCHWCHVMERESFENDEIAALMNENFINIKVDREERPDIDSIYMNYVQMITGSGGWPLTVFLTPDQVPFYGGTYFPPEDRFGRPGFKRVLESVASAYTNRQEDIEKARPVLLTRLEETSRFEIGGTELSLQIFSEAFFELSRQYDQACGGFGGAPKFPSAMSLAFLLRYHKRTSDPAALDMVESSLERMAEGGIYDQLGGGFHRYTVDDQWLVPHFEKMLYDNALLGRLYLEAFQATGRKFYSRVVEETLEWVLREMTHPEGGFFSALDADSEGEEGKFYLWTRDEVEEIVGAEAFSIFATLMDVTDEGNFEGHTILHLTAEPREYARRHFLTEEEVEKQLTQAKLKLLAAREKRVRPGLDDKVLSAWNGLMLGTMARAGFILDRQDFLNAALRCGELLIRDLYRDGRLQRTWKNGEARLNGYLEDSANVTDGFIALYESTGDSRWLKFAQALTDHLYEFFLDETAGDFYFTSKDHEVLLVRQKEFLDNATPSGNSMTCLNLLKLGRLLDREDYWKTGELLLKRVSLGMARHPLGFGLWLQALDYYFGPQLELVVLGTPENRAELLSPIKNSFQPGLVLICSDPGTAGDSESLPHLRGKTLKQGRATAYLCREFSCREPVTSPVELEQQLMTSTGPSTGP